MNKGAAAPFILMNHLQGVTAMSIEWGYVDPPDQETELATIATLATTFRMIPESTEYGTAACRLVIVGQHGIIDELGTSNRAPLTYEVANMVSKATGASNGKWKLDKLPDRPPNNRLTMTRDISTPWLPNPSHDALWNYGVCYARSDGLTGYFFPYFPTVYTDDTSVLKDMVSVMGCIVQEQIAVETWARFVPTGRLTDGELSIDAETYVKARSLEVYGDRFVVQPKVYFSPFDMESGRSFTLNSNIYCNSSRHTATYSVVAHRSSDL